MYLYRIQSFDRVVQIFETCKLYFSHPSQWDDPYEQKLKHKISHALFAQCWCKKAVSDAMWRIYSSDKLGVRIRTTDKNLKSHIRKKIQGKNLAFMVDSVEYYKQIDIDCKIKAIEMDLQESFDNIKAARSLLLKREAFNHESEVRAIIFDKVANSNKKPDSVKKGIQIEVDPNFLIDNIQIDPRAPKAFVEAYKFYFCEKLEFTGRITKSPLYENGEG